MTYVLPTIRAAFLAMLLVGVVAWDAGPLQSGGVWVDRSAIVHVDPSGGAAAVPPADCARSRTREALFAVRPIEHAVSTPDRITLRGRASWVRASLGGAYLAARLPKGTRLRVCGPRGCIVGTVNDYGPSRRIVPHRVVDLSRAYFRRVCGDPAKGTCRVRVAIVR